MSIVRFFIGALGALAATVGAVLVAVAVGIGSWVGTADRVAIPTVHVATDQPLVIRDVDLLLGDRSVVPDLGSVSLRFRSEHGRPLFAGIAPTSTVDGFVASGGGAAASQTFWVTSDEGTSAVVDWEIQPGAWSVVVAGADEGLVIDGDLTAAPFRTAALTVGAIGAGAIVAGGLMLVAAFSLRRRPVTTMPVDDAPVAASV